MSNKELVSIIVPIFNTAEYLRECLDSLKNQSYENLEIIMVNDGSTDNSAAICKEYCEKDNRFSLIEQKNQGLGASRNIGLEHASGEYVCFVDSDDYVHEKYVEILYENLNKYQTDISMCSYMRFRYGKIENVEVMNRCSILTKYQMLKDITTTGPNNRSEPIVISWNKMVRMNIIKHLRFVNKYHEDEYMINELLLKVTNAVSTEAILYFYRQRPDSITGIKNRESIRHMEVLDAIYNRITIFLEAEFADIFPNMLYSCFENSTAVYYSLLPFNNKFYLMRKIFPQYFVTLLRYANKLKFKKFLRYFLFLISPSFYKKKYWS